jgi:tetratricopeptide (TPR) repeat protein
MSKIVSRIKSLTSFRVLSSPVWFAPALVICLLLLTASGAVALAGDKPRHRAERALRSGQYEEAETLFREALAENSRDKTARLGLSYTLLKMRRFADAYDQAASVVALDPLSARAHSLLGSALLGTGDFQTSVEEFRTALSLDSDEPLAVSGLAMVDFYENRMGPCIEGLRRAISLDSREPDFVFNLAQASARAERYREAADAYERFLKIAPRTDEDRRARIRGLIDFLRYLGGKQQLYYISGANQTSVQFDMPNNRPIIKVRVNGRKEPLRFVLDTGSAISVISDETAKALGIRAVARGGMARAVGGKFEIVYGFLQSIELGDARIDNVPVYIRHFYNDETPVDGFIGLAVLSKYLTTVDYGARSFSLSRQRANPDADSILSTPGFEIPMRTTSSGFLSGEVQVDGVRRAFNFIIDTGASISVVSKKAMELDEMSGFKHPARMRVYGAAGIADGVQMLILPRIVLGSHAREKVDVAVLDLEPVNETTGFIQSGIIGGNFLRYFRVTFNFRKSVILLEPLNSTASTMLRKTQAGAAAATTLAGPL